jgi:hypothetical protein
MIRQYLTRADGAIPPSVDRAALERAGVRIVRPTPLPRQPGMIAVEMPAEQRDGVWWQVWRLEPAPKPEPSPVPQSVSPLQARRALRAAQLMEAVEALIADASEEVREAWEYAVEIRRDDATLAVLAAELGMTDAQLDDLFRDAASL